MKTTSFKIKRYKAGRGKGLLIILACIAAVAAVLFFLKERQVLSLPAFTAPALSAGEAEQQIRVITLPAGQWFALQLGAFEEEKSAQAQADSFRSRGAAGYVHQDDTCRVLAAAYESRESARAVQAQLAQKHGVDAYLYPLSRSEVTLRLSGQKAQLDALEDAFSLCDQLTYTLSGLSQTLDKGEITAREAIEALSSQLETVQSIRSRLLARFAKDEHDAVLSLSAMLAETEKWLAQAIQSPDTASLGSSIRYCQLHLLCSLEAYVRLLTP